MKIISDNKSLAELYSDLLIRQREIQREIENETAICQCCGHPKSKHLGDMRCSSWACSSNFHHVRTDEAAKIQRAVTLIEELRAI